MFSGGIMKTILFATISLLASSIGARTVSTSPGSPIVEFPAGRYLGLGHYVTADNQRGTYSSYADIDEDSWQVNYLREYGADAYQVEFAFNENGSFDVVLHEYVNDEVQLHMGNGYCQSVQCHINVDLGNRLYEETVTFLPAEKKIYRLGSISSRADPISDEDEADLIMSWEEAMIRVDREDENKKKNPR